MARIVELPQVRRPPRQAKPGTAPGRGGGGVNRQPPFVPTDAQRRKVRQMVACGFTTESISVITEIPCATLERHFPFELQHGKLMTDSYILGGIVDSAEEGDKTMRIFYAKARAGWRDAGPSADALPTTLFSISIGGAPSDSAAEISVKTIAGIAYNGKEEEEP
jgi:hypothetical protein